MVCYFNVDKGGTRNLTGESDWAVFTTPRDNRGNIDDCSYDPNKRIEQYKESIKDDHYIYRFPLYIEDKTNTTGSETISIGSAAIDINDTIILPVTIINAADIQQINFNLDYNPEILTIQNISVNNTIPSLTIDYTIDAGTAVIKITNSEQFTITSATPIIDISFQGTENTGLSELELQSVEFVDDIGSHAPGTIINGSIRVCIRGDFNYNDRVDIGDAAKISFYLAEKVDEL